MSTTTGHLVEAMDGASLAEAGRPAWGFVRDVLSENSGAVHVEDRVEDVAEFGSVRKKVNDWISATGRPKPSGAYISRTGYIAITWPKCSASPARAPPDCAEHPHLGHGS